MLTLLCLTTLLNPGARADLADSQQPNASLFRSMRYGIFNHIVYGASITPDGKRSYTNLDDFVSKFNVKAYADQIKAIGVEYVIFTGWHRAIYNLGPNDALEKWLPGHTAKRDLIGEVADALNERGIKLIIYAHPSDAHDLTKQEQTLVGYTPGLTGTQPKYNDFINDVYGELARRYGSKPNVIGFWWDSWGKNGGCLDAPRLRKTVLGIMPRAIILSNGFNPSVIDFFSAECNYWHCPQDDIDGLKLGGSNQTTTFAGNWMCDDLTSKSHYSPETLFRFTALNSCTNSPGGICWAVSPAADGTTFSSDILQVMQKLGSYIQPIRESICGVAPWSDWPVKGGLVFSTAPAYGSTRSQDGLSEYVHVVKPPQGNSIDLTAPEVTPVASFTSAQLLPGNHPVKLEATPTGLRLTLPAGDSWNPLDTVIKLSVDHPITVLATSSPQITWTGGWGDSPVRHSRSRGDSVVIQFSGTSIKWIGVTGPEHGKASVILDNQKPVEVDLGAGDRKDHAICFGLDHLEPGPHTLQITNSSGAWVEIERLLITP